MKDRFQTSLIGILKKLHLLFFMREYNNEYGMKLKSPQKKLEMLLSSMNAFNCKNLSFVLNWLIMLSMAFIMTIIWLSFFSLWFAGKTRCVLQTRTHFLLFLISNKENIAILSALRNPTWSTLFFFFSSLTFSFKVSDHMRLNLDEEKMIV